MSESITQIASDVSAVAGVVASVPASAPLFHPSNIVNSPGSTAAALGLASTLIGSLATNGVPNNTAGWMSFAMTSLMSVAALFAK